MKQIAKCIALVLVTACLIGDVYAGTVTFVEGKNQGDIVGLEGIGFLNVGLGINYRLPNTALYRGMYATELVEGSGVSWAYIVDSTTHELMEYIAVDWTVINNRVDFAALFGSQSPAPSNLCPTENSCWPFGVQIGPADTFVARSGDVQDITQFFNGPLPFGLTIQVRSGPYETIPDPIYIPPGIPEPETYAMMLAGLGLIGLVARRRKQETGSRKQLDPRLT